MGEEKVDIAKQLLIGLLERMGINAEVDGSLKEGDLILNVTSDKEGILIGKHGRILDSLLFLINRMINKQLRESVKVYLDINHYKVKRSESLSKMAIRLGEKVKWSGKPFTVGPFNPHDRRIIHMALKEDPLLETESIGEAEMKRIKIISKSQVP